MNYEKKADKIIEKFSSYTSGVRMLMLIQRGKEGGKGETNNKKTVRRITTNSGEFRNSLIELLEIKEKKKGIYRIYSCVNSRNINKAIRIFKQRQLDADYFAEDQKYKFYTDIKNNWISAVMNPSTKETSLFILDIDEGQDVKEVKERLSQITRNYTSYETKNGHHIVSMPFNPELLKGVHILKDGLLLLDY